MLAILASPTKLIVVLAWACFLFYWIFSVAGKNRSDRVFNLLRTIGLLCVVVLLFLFIGAGGIPDDVNPVLWHSILPVRVCADAIAIISLVVLIRSRRILGANWSSNVRFDRATELIKSGPYAYVRHPIYSGLIGLVLGTIIAYGRLVGVLIWVACVVALYLKSRKEDLLMLKKFNGEYLEYKSRTKALFPFVL